MDRREHMLFGDEEEDVDEALLDDAIAAPRPLHNPAWKLLRLPVFLLALGVVSALVKVGLEGCVGLLWALRMQLAMSASNVFVGAIMWTLFGIFVLQLAVAWTATVAPHAAGSGIPEMKSILSGVELEHFLTFSTLLSKIGGLILALGSGLQIGAEGPFVHISSVIASLLAELRMFSFVRRNESLKQRLLTAGCAVGIATNFGAPVGGVLFGVEAVGTYYLVSNYPATFFSSIAGAIVFLLLGGVLAKSPIINTGNEASTDALTITALFKTKVDIPNKPWELALFVLLGVMMGILGAMFVRFNGWVVKRRRESNSRLLKSKYFLPAMVMLVSGLLTYPRGIGEFLSLPPRRAISDLFSEQPLDGSGDGLLANDWASRGGIGVGLLLFAILKLFMVAVATTLAVPSGVYTPVFAVGAALGRLLGEAVALSASHVVPGGYAIVGAAALAAGVTRTMSSAVIVFELTGQMSHTYPVLVAVLAAYMTGNFLSESLYDNMAILRELPILGQFKRQKSLIRACEDIMQESVVCIQRQTSFEQIAQLLESYPFSTIAIVEPLHDGMPGAVKLIGTVKRSEIEGLLLVQEQYAVFRIKEGNATPISSRPISLPAKLQRLASTPASTRSSPSSASGDEIGGLTQSLPMTSNADSRPHIDDVDIESVSSQGNSVVSPGNFSTPRKSIPEELMEGGSRTNSPTNSLPHSPSSFRESGRKKETRKEVLNRRLSVQLQSYLANSPEQTQRYLSKSIDILDEKFKLKYDRFPLTVADVTPLARVHFMFSVMNLSHIYVIADGALVGVITKNELSNRKL